MRTTSLLFATTVALFAMVSFAPAQTPAPAATPAAAASPSATPEKHHRLKKAAAALKGSPAPAASATPAPAASATPAPAAAASPSPAKMTRAQKKAAKAASASPAPAPEETPTATVAPGGGNGMVWVNTKSHVFHKEGSRFYGKTKKGKYLSEQDAVAEGDHASPKEK